MPASTGEGCTTARTATVTVANQPLVAYGHDADGFLFGLGSGLTTWSSAVLMCTDGTELDGRWRCRLHANSIAVNSERIARLRGADRSEAVVFSDGREQPAAGLFFHTRLAPAASGLGARLGCTFNAERTVQTGHNEATNMSELFVAGDASRRRPLIVAAEGADAAAAINAALLREDLQ